MSPDEACAGAWVGVASDAIVAVLALGLGWAVAWASVQIVRLANKPTIPSDRDEGGG